MLIDLADLIIKASTAFHQKKAFVLYRKPNENIVHGQFQHFNEVLNYTDFTQSGFLLAPFEKSEPSVFFESKYADCFQSIYTEIYIKENNVIKSTDDLSLAKENHMAIVDKALNAIKNNTFKKVVLSRKEVLNFSNFELSKTFYLLLNKYPTAMVYCWYHPTIGFWMGATPELLFKVKNKQFSTMALAGTQVANNQFDVIWTAKEKAEQQLVTDFIIDAIKTDIENIDVKQPNTVKAGNLWHIKTTINGVVNNEENIKKIITKLHPTPAVCGMPKEKSLTFILENELYKREFYTGYLGTINNNQQIDLYVNLRCMKVENNTISIYVGGGITEDSNAEEEWFETVAKSSTMKNVLF